MSATVVKASGFPYDDRTLQLVIDGLVQALPPAGARWPIEQRKQWLEAAERIFRLIYSD